MLPLKLRDLLLSAAMASASLAFCQTAPPAAGTAASSGARILGTVTAISGGSVTVKQEGAATTEIPIAITAQTRLLRLAPGEKSLKNATPLALADLAVGDRVLVRATADSTPDHPSAGVLIAMKQADISQAHEQETADWQQRGVAGIVQAVDVPAGTLTLKAQGGAAPVVIHVTAASEIKHYAPDSTAFTDAHKVPFSDIHAGDQVRARGQKAEDGTTVEAEEVVAGSFKNIAGTILTIDAGANTVSLTDLATKRPVTLHLEEGTQLRRLPPEMAARMAHREGAATGGAPSAGRAAGAPDGSGAGSGGAPGAGPAAAGPSGRARGAGGEMAGMLQRAPKITLADLKKGDAVMIVASGPGATQPTAITLIAGVEPLLQASPEASAGLFSASWNLNGGGGEAGGDGAPQR